MEDPGTIDLGFFLLSVSEDSLHIISKGIKELARRSRRDGNLHDLTLLLDSESAGLTIHCTYKSREQAEAALGIHCTQRKYTTKAINWFGICIDPDDKSLRFGMSWHHEWQQSDKLDVLVKDLPKTGQCEVFLEVRSAIAKSNEHSLPFRDGNVRDWLNHNKQPVQLWNSTPALSKFCIDYARPSAGTCRLNGLC